MLTHDIVETLLSPISETSRCGEDLEYDAAFIALESAAQGKAEQQFGDTVIPAIEPEWPQVAEQAQALLRRSKDVRVAVLLLRAATRTQGLQGFLLGMQFLHDLVDRYWDALHPALDVDDDNDPTMRINALAPLVDEQLLPRDLLEARIGVARSMGPLRVRDVAIARNAFPATENSFSAAQVEGALQEIAADDAQTPARLLAATSGIAQLQTLISARTGRDGALDLTRLRSYAQALRQAGAALTHEGDPSSPTDMDGRAADTHSPMTGPAGAVGAVGARADIQSRQDAILMLDRVIAYLERTEPGNPAPLLIERAKKLIGVSFLDIIANLAPDAMSSIEQVTGARATD